MSPVEKLQHWEFKYAFCDVDESPEDSAKLRDNFHVSKFADGTPVKLYWYHDIEMALLGGKPQVVMRALEKKGSQELRLSNDSVAFGYPLIYTDISIAKGSVRTRFCVPLDATHIAEANATPLGLG